MKVYVLLVHYDSGTSALIGAFSDPVNAKTAAERNHTENGTDKFAPPLKWTGRSPMFSQTYRQQWFELARTELDKVKR